MDFGKFFVAVFFGGFFGHLTWKFIHHTWPNRDWLVDRGGELQLCMIAAGIFLGLVAVTLISIL
jgi:hypothetical protein